MRPLELEIAGFRSHRAATMIDFSGRTFLAIVGPIGAGKSSILDAICFALYGKTPKVKNEPRRLICSRADAAHVRLRFSVDSSEYEVTRSLPRKGSGEHVLLDVSSGDRVVGARDVTERVEELLGLSFGAFCSSILLAQGQFDEFLRAAPDHRTKILKGVFRFDQVTALHHAARARLAELKEQLAGIEGELRAIPHDIDELIAGERERLAGIAERVAEMEEALPRQRRLQDDIRVAQHAQETAEKRAQVLEDAAAGLPEETALDDLVVRDRAANERAEKAERAVAARQAARARAEEAFAALERDLGNEAILTSTLDKAQGLQEASVELADAEVRRTELEQQANEARTAAEAARAAEAEAEAVLADASARLLDAERADMAHVLRGHLRVGEPCPVCEQTVEARPKLTTKPALQQLRKEEQRAKQTLQRARADAHAAAKQSERVTAGLEHHTKELARVRSRVERIRAQLENVLGDVDDFAVEAKARLKRVRAATKTAKEAVADVEAALEERRRADKELATVARERRTIAATLIRIADKAATAAPDLECATDELLARATEARVALEKAVAEAEADAAAAREKVAAAEQALQALRAAFKLEKTMPIETALATARAEQGHCRGRIAELERHRERMEELRGERDRLGGRRDVFLRLTDDLRDSNFVNFLLEERRRLLSELGSERLVEMTGRYRFSDDAEFDVIDELDADKRRDVETLSGGETFLASLALALALAEGVMREGGRLESFFLDEGFGSLDAEAFDHALDGIERIVIEDRLIGLVSHLPALATRVEDKIVLDKSEDGSTLVVSGTSR